MRRHGAYRSCCDNNRRGVKKHVFFCGEGIDWETSGNRLARAAIRMENARPPSGGAAEFFLWRHERRRRPHDFSGWHACPAHPKP